MAGADPARDGYNPNETLLSTSNVANLVPLWSASLDAVVAASPAVANGVIYVGSQAGTFYAYSVGCSTDGGTCTPLWQAYVGQVFSTPAVVNGVVYVVSIDGVLHAFAVGCNSGGGTCTPLWTAKTGSWSSTSPVVSDGVVYVGGSDSMGTVFVFSAYAVGCNTGGGTCTPLWTANLGSGVSQAAVSDGVVYVGSDKLYAFAVGCNTGGGTCTPLWTGDPGGSYLYAPAVAGGVVYVGSASAGIYAFAVGCNSGGGSCSPIWHAITSSAVEWSPSVANGVVYAATNDDLKLYAFAVGCNTGGGTCTPLWTASSGSRTSPAVANGVVYAGGSAFAVGCNTGGGTCTPVWKTSVAGAVWSSATIANGMVYLGVGSYLYAFGLQTDYLVLSPSDSTIAAGGSQTYAAQGYDVSDYDLGDLTGKATFSIGGRPCGGATCSAGSVGNFVVRATYGKASGWAILRVTAGSFATHITGKVMNAGSAGLPGIEVDAYRQDGSLVNLAMTASDGTYSVPAPAGTYSLYFWDSTGAYGSGYLGAGGFTYDASAAVDMTIGSADVTDKDVVLPGAVHIKGTVRDQGSKAIGGMVVDAYDSATLAWSGEAITDSHGHYSMAVPPGAYVVRFWDPGGVYPMGYWRSSGFTNILAQATVVAVSAADVTGIDIQMPAGHALRGNVTNPSHAGQSGIDVYAYDSTTLDVRGQTVTDAVGQYSMHLLSGFYYIEFWDPTETYPDGFWSLSGFTDQFRLASTVAVSTSDVAGISVQLPGGHLVSGTVTNTSSVALPGIKVSVYNAADGYLVAVAITDSAGAYSAALESGWYYISYSDPSHAYATGYWGGGGLTLDPDAAVEVTVGAAPVTGLDVQMPATAFTGATYHAISPTRVLDTRNGTGGISGPFTNHAARTFTVAGGSSGVPTNATAVTGTLTVTGQTSGGFLFIGPAASNNPTSSTLNFPIADDRANAVTVALGAGGTLSITFVGPGNGKSAQAVFDVTGYFAPDTIGATYHAISPTRVLDTRNGAGGLSGPFTNHAARTFQVAGGASGVPAGATAVTGNLTVTGQTSSGYLFIGPVATNDPTSSTLNFPVGDDRANAATVALSATGTLSVTFVAPSTGPSAQAIFDVTGYFTPDMSGAAYVPLTPSRRLDTRNGTGGLSGPFTNHAARTFQVTGGSSEVPTNATAVTGNMTVTGQTSGGYLFIGPVATNDPTSSTLNFPVGDDRANAVTVALSATGTLSVTFVAPSNGQSAQAIFDVTGYFLR
ncbi:MAG: outer membrane protein assembly factor BamB family protein [Candidatus Limnocylindrales bacterium]